MSNSVILLGKKETFGMADDVIGRPVAQTGRLTGPEDGAFDLMLQQL